METWASKELKGSKFGHERFRPNAIKILTCLGEKPGLSFSAALGSASRKAANRLLSNTEIELQKGHVEQTLERCGEEELLLAIEDMTSINYHSHKGKKGMGRIGGKFDTKGIYMQSVLCVTTEGEPLGLIGQHIWAPVPSKLKTDGILLHKLPIEEKESMKWIRQIRTVNEVFKKRKNKVLIITDREGDFYEHFSEPRNQNVEILVRGSHLERKIEYNGSECIVQDLSILAEVQHTYDMELPKQKEREPRNAKIAVRYGKIKYPPTVRKKGAIVNLYFIHAAEIDYNEKDKIEWYLFTSMPVENSKDAVKMIGFYAKRWIIERFHYVLKTGLKIESIQIDVFERLKGALELYSIVAWRILWLLYVGKAKPEEKAVQVFESKQIQTLEHLNQKKIITVKDFLLAMGKLVGFQPSRKQPIPGEKLLWIAYGQLIQIFRGVELASKVTFNGTG